MPAFRIHSDDGDYSVEIERGILARAGSHPMLRGRDCVVITNARLLALHGQALLNSFPKRRRPPVLLHRDGERAKTLRTCEELLRSLARGGARRDTVLLALGGGVTGDITGFVAAMYMRGVDYVHLPTTLMAQVDSSIGGKTGVDLPEGKNLVGAFHPPRAVLSDSDALGALPQRDFRAGLYECVKTAIAVDSSLASFLEQNIGSVLLRNITAVHTLVRMTASAKARIVDADEHDRGPRMFLNFGHTFGHAIEAALNYRTLKHGEAVAWGMLAAIQLSVRYAGLARDEADRMRALVRAAGTLPRFRADASDMMQHMERDKKRTHDGLQFVLVTGIGIAKISPFTSKQIMPVVRDMLAEARP